jgi:crotonobetainyl-CoA:carnitine CoA-transferase CaiB-like acyl-CoA transferase
VSVGPHEDGLTIFITAVAATSAAPSAVMPPPRHRAMRVDRDGYRGIGLPTKLSRTPGRPAASPTRYAQHTDEVLREAGLSDARIASLRDGGVLPVVRSP